MNILDETNKIIEANGIDALGTYLLWFVQKALPKKEITIYEAFQLMEMSIRYRDYISQRNNWSCGFDIVEFMNMALMARLFEEQELYKHFCAESLNKREIWYDGLKKDNGGKLPKLDKYYYLVDLEKILSADLESMEMLSQKRFAPKRKKDRLFIYHWTLFPYDYFVYEDELIKVLKGEIDHYDVDKTISPEICDMMVAIELRALDLESE